MKIHSTSHFQFFFFLKNKKIKGGMGGLGIDSNQAKCCSSNMSKITSMPSEEPVEPVRSAEHGQSASAASGRGFNKTASIKAQLYGQFHLFGIFFFLKDLHTFFFFFFFSPKVVINNFKFGGKIN